MKKFVVYEVWTRSYIIDAEDIDDALQAGDSETDRISKVLAETLEGKEAMHLSNWHAVEVD